jgi:hypothetical protein
MTLRIEHVAAPLVVLADYAALSWFSALAAATGHPEAAFRVGAVLFVAMNAGLLLLGHRRLPAGLLGAPLVAAAARVSAPAGSRVAALAILIVVGVTYRLSTIARTPLDPHAADMLPLITAASLKVLAGVNPYRRPDGLDAGPTSPAAPSPPPDGWIPYVPAWPPGLWLPYVPAVWAGFDLRLVGLLAALLTAALLGLAAWSRRDEPVVERVTAWPRVAVAGALLVAPAAAWFGAIGHTQTYWLYLTALVWALARRWPGVAGVCVGLCVTSRHTVLALVPPLALYAWRGLTPGERLRLGAGAAAVVGALALAFGAAGLWQFAVGSPVWYMKFGDQGWNGPRWWVTHTFGISTFLYPLGWSRAIPWVGAALVLAVYGLAWRRLRDVPSCVRCLALTLLVVTVCVPTPFRYEFVPIILLISTLPLLAPQGRGAGPARAT